MYLSTLFAPHIDRRSSSGTPKAIQRSGARWAKSAALGTVLLAAACVSALAQDAPAARAATEEGIPVTDALVTSKCGTCHKKDEKGNTQDTLEKKEKKKSKRAVFVLLSLHFRFGRRAICLTAIRMRAMSSRNLGEFASVRPRLLRWDIGYSKIGRAHV